MSYKSLFDKYLKRKTRKTVASIAIFAESVTLAYEKEQVWITDEMAVNNAGEWGKEIKSLVDKHQLTGCSLRLVLGHGYYQSMLIEKPELPREEYPTALPFLVKDLVNESPLNLLADGFPAPLKDRLQVFVANRQQVELLIRDCTDVGCEVQAITAEEVVWGQLAEPTRSQLILHRRRHANLHLTAFKQQEICFQRQLRGFPAPLLESDNAEDLTRSYLQLDSLALELQRSLDFLSAQLRDAPITQLLVSCDDEDDIELAKALAERLNVAVAAVTPAHPGLESNSARIAQAALLLPQEGGINFYSDVLKPQTQWMTLQNVVLSWALIVVVMGSVAGWYQWQHYQQKQQLAAEQQRLNSKKAELDRAKEALAKHVPSPLKVELAGNLEQHLAAKQATLKAIEMHDDSLKVGYAGMLRQLSDAASGDISLSRIRVSGTLLDLEGLARSPEAVPGWLQAFKDYSHLSERRFEQMTLGRNQENIVTFKLQAVRSTEKEEQQ